MWAPFGAPGKTRPRRAGNTGSHGSIVEGGVDPVEAELALGGDGTPGRREVFAPIRKDLPHGIPERDAHLLPSPTIGNEHRQNLTLASIFAGVILTPASTFQMDMVGRVGECWAPTSNARHAGMTGKRTKPAAAKAGTRIAARNKRAILDAAIGVFTEKGYDGASIAEIAKRSKLPKANVYYYFGSKEAIYRTFIGDLITAVGQGPQ